MAAIKFILIAALVTFYIKATECVDTTGSNEKKWV